MTIHILMSIVENILISLYQHAGGLISLFVLCLSVSLSFISLFSAVLKDIDLKIGIYYEFVLI